MTDCVQFFTAEGTRVEKFPVFLPPYKVVLRMDGDYDWLRLDKTGHYGKLGTGTYSQAVYGVLTDCRRVNVKFSKHNWRSNPDLADGSVAYEHELKEGAPGTIMYLTLDCVSCVNSQAAVWKLTKIDTDWYTVSRRCERDMWVSVYENRLYYCRKFTENQYGGIRECLIDLYRSNRGLGLYRYVAMLSQQGTCSLLGGIELHLVVQDAINYSRSWTTRAIRIGERCINQQGTGTVLPRPKDTSIDWNVTHLSYLCRLEDSEIQYLIDRGMLSPVMTGDEVGEVVKQFLQDPERRLMHDCRANMVS